jgi:glycosyltransferase involved in cell wall biosynthesis
VTRTKIVFLYTELAEYFLACIKELSKIEKYDIHIFRWPLNKEAPFDLNLPNNVNAYTKGDDFIDSNLLRNIDRIDPDIILCSGWIDKGYVDVCKKYNKKIPTVLLMDNQWENTLKKRIATVIGKLTLKKIFSNVWVPGTPQFNYAKRLGYDDDRIKQGFYSADVDLFNSIYNASLEGKKAVFPKVFLYVGRYVKHKGIYDMWEAFIQLKSELNTDWELWCVGTGDEFNDKVEYRGIKHFGFKQPKELTDIINNSGVYILPSHFEPWGVTVHEFAAAGMPIVCSDKVGAASQFVENGLNGYTVESKSVEAIKLVMKKIIFKSDDELRRMSVISCQRSKSITPKIWCNTLNTFLE